MSHVAPCGYPFREEKVMLMLGLKNATEMRSMRKELLEDGVHWARIDGRICYSEAGAEKLAVAMVDFPLQMAKIEIAKKSAGLAVSEFVCDHSHFDTSSTEKTRHGQPAKRDDVKKLARVLRHQIHPNRRILIAYVEGVGEIHVPVKDCTYFKTHGATNTVLVSLDGYGRWQFAGNPAHPNNNQPHCPRFPGRW